MWRIVRVGLLASIIGLACSEGSRPPSGPEPTLPSMLTFPDSLALSYREDAARLALRARIDNGPHPVPIEIPVPRIDAFFASLAQVYDLVSAERDSVFSVYGIHTFEWPELRSLIVAVNESYGWTEAWQNGKTWTGYDAVDKLIEAHALTLVRYRESGSYAVLESARPVYMSALADAFEEIPGVRYASPNQRGGDGNDIVVRTGPSFLELDFSVGYGDCPAGCLYRRHWVFRVDGPGRARFVGSYGDPPP